MGRAAQNARKKVFNMAQWQFCEECGHCYLEMRNGKFCTDECAKKKNLDDMKKYRRKLGKRTAALGQIAHEIIRKRWRPLTPDAIEELRIQADKLIDFCDEWEWIPHD